MCHIVWKFTCDMEVMFLPCLVTDLFDVCGLLATCNIYLFYVYGYMCVCVEWSDLWPTYWLILTLSRSSFVVKGQSGYTGCVKKSKLLCCDRYFYRGLDNSPNMKYSIILWAVWGLKVGNTNSICVVKYSLLHNFMTSCLRKLVRVCLAVISLTAFSHRIFKHKTIVRYNVSRENIRQCSVFSVDVRICSHSSYLPSFIDIFAENQRLTFLTHPVFVILRTYNSESHNINKVRISCHVSIFGLWRHS